MKKTGLKNFDIASFDMEIEFNKKLAPIKKKIDTLNRNHEKKSLDNHKDFLSKEKKSQKKLTELDEKVVLREQRIIKATENKLKRYVNSDAKLNAQFEEFKKAQEEANVILLQEIDDIVAEMKIAEQKDLEAITLKYDESVKSYTEKLSTYNENFEKNVQRHTEHLDKYQKLVDAKIKEIHDFKVNSATILDQELEDFIKQNEARKEEVEVENKEKQREYTRQITQVKRVANVKIKEFRANIEEMKDALADKYDSYIETLKEHISTLVTDFSARKALIETDRDINLDKLKATLEESEELPPKLKKSIDMKLDIFEQRAATTIQYEETLLNEQVRLLEDEIIEVQETKRLELLNIDKLEVFLVSDQQELKDSGDHFKQINFKLLTDFNKSEFTHSEYLEKHEKLKNEYFKTFNDTFNAFKLAILEANQSTIERLGQINHEIDEINKFLDTAEPLKEIEVNNIRVDIERSEVIERYKIKYAKQDHERKQLLCNLEKEIMIEELNSKAERINDNKMITDIKNKEQFDKDIEKAKLKFNKAEEIARLGHNQVRLERSLLKSNYETEAAITDHKKEIAEIEIMRENALLSNELKAKINNIELEAKYKTEVVNQSLIEENLKLDDEINQLLLLQKENDTKIDKDIKEINRDFDKQQKALDKEFEKKEKLIDKALERELKEPRKSLDKSNQLIDSRMIGFTQNQEFYVEFIDKMTKNITDETINDEQRKIIMNNDSMFIDKSKAFIENLYQYLDEAIQFIHELEERTIQSKLASTNEESKKRKLNKELQKVHQDFDRQNQKLDENRKQNLKLITDDIYKGMEEISNFDVEKDGNIATYITSMLENVQAALLNLQSGVVTDVSEMYKVLTKADQAIIENAEENAKKAKVLLEQEKQNTLQPYKNSLEASLEAKETERTDLNRESQEKINELKGEINRIKNHALEQVKAIDDTKQELARPYLEKLDKLTSSEAEKIQKQKDTIDSRKKDLELQYRESLNELSIKDSEIEKILEYEKRIFDLAQETLEARQKDSNQKTQKAADYQRQSIDKGKAEVLEKHEKTLLEINKELIELTKEYENNIFTVRPRLEESIGDAEKVIDSEMKEKTARLEELNEISYNVMNTLEAAMLIKFEECYSTLLDNLQFYFDKLKLIKDEHMRNERDNNDIIEETNATFSQALFELSKAKHTKTLKKLLAINSEMTGKEE